MPTTTPTPGTQQFDVLRHLKNIGQISGLEAIALYRVTSLTKVMSVLRSWGWEITAQWRRDHTGKRYVRYFLANEQRCSREPS